MSDNPIRTAIHQPRSLPHTDRMKLVSERFDHAELEELDRDGQKDSYGPGPIHPPDVNAPSRDHLPKPLARRIRRNR